MLCRHGEDELPGAVPPRTADLGERRRGQQLRQRTLLHRPDGVRRGHGQSAQDGGQLRRTQRLPLLPLVRRRHRLGSDVTAHAGDRSGLPEEEQTGVRRLPGSAGKTIGLSICLEPRTFLAERAKQAKTSYLGPYYTRQLGCDIAGLPSVIGTLGKTEKIDFD